MNPINPNPAQRDPNRPVIEDRIETPPTPPFVEPPRTTPTPPAPELPIPSVEISREPIVNPDLYPNKIRSLLVAEFGELYKQLQEKNPNLATNFDQRGDLFIEWIIENRPSDPTKIQPHIYDWLSSCSLIKKPYIDVACEYLARELAELAD